MDRCLIIKDNKETIGDHIRMKGIPSSTIKREYDDSISFYKRLSKGEKIELDIAKDNVIFKHSKDGTISDCTKFLRSSHFPGKLNTIIL